MKLQLATQPVAMQVEMPPLFKAVPNLKRIELLTEANRPETLDFLNRRPVHTVAMASFIQDNGLEGADNRGKFYGYRNAAGKLEGVALIGHSTLIETISDAALAAFALVARRSETPIKLMMSDGDTIERFWNLYADAGQKPRHLFKELLFEINFPFLVQNCKWEIRPAKLEELEAVAEAHAEVAFIESGINPMETDREGYLRRCAKRIEKQRTFVATENGKLVFKADIVAETDVVVYLEGIYTAPEYRGKGVASECLSKLGLMLLDRVQHVCMLSNVEFKAAHRAFNKAGFSSMDHCQTIFV